VSAPLAPLQRCKRLAEASDADGLDEDGLGEEPVKVDFMLPPKWLITCWAMHLHKDRLNPIKEGCIADHTASTIKTYLGGIAGTSGLLGRLEPGAASTMTAELKEQLATWKDQDETNGAPAFDFCKDLPLLWKVLWTIDGWTKQKMIKCWAMFLVAICMMARASDITTYCPSFDDIKLPVILTLT
jgi:hypothetical protein